MKNHILNNSFFIVLLISFVVSSGPLKTVPWKGHKGAVSFTFDDGVANQITNVMPALKTRGIHGTFYLIGNWNNNNPSPWIQASRDGNEIGNHTRSFDGLTQMNSASITTAIVDEAKYSRNQDTSIECVTLAYPGCGRNDMVDAVATTENFIGRTCSFGDFGDAHFYWNKEPANWMSMCAAYIDGLSGFQNAGKRIDEAAGKNTWFSTLVHGVGDANIPTESVTAMFDQAIKDSLWIETYQRVASYWRASFTMDTVNAVANGSGWKLNWKSPHPKMPKSVPLLVTLDKSFFGNTVFVYQNGKEISPFANGSYPIEFMNMQLTVTTKENTFISKSGISSDVVKTFMIETTPQGPFLKLKGFNGDATLTIYDLKGASVYRKICSANKIMLPELHKGVYIIKFIQGNTRLTGNFPVK